MQAKIRLESDSMGSFSTTVRQARQSSIGIAMERSAATGRTLDITSCQNGLVSSSFSNLHDIDIMLAVIDSPYE